MTEEIVFDQNKESLDSARDDSSSFENILEKNKYTAGLLLLGILLIGLGILGSKYFNLWGNGAKVEILGNETGSEAKEVGSESAYAKASADKSGERSEGGAVSKITVEIAGEIIKPGVYELDIGSRVNDLLISSGGLSANADRDWVAKNINLAQKLQDGVKIFIPRFSINPNPSNPSNSSDSQTSKININTASIAELDTLWGIGEATVKKIIDNRPYSKPEELLEKKIVKSNVWETIKDKVTVY